jgi:hypothetical protein
MSNGQRESEDRCRMQQAHLYRERNASARLAHSPSNGARADTASLDRLLSSSASAGAADGLARGDDRTHRLKVAELREQLSPRRPRDLHVATTGRDGHTI